ncbi:MAG: hypothetical protein KF703_09055 [Actinobacteria bacterium]|nr:hypothetical protein [Actinomycetota bacterium]
MGGKAHRSCSDCQDCGGRAPVDAAGLHPGVTLGVAGRRRRDRLRHRVCDHCGHAIRFHALDVAPSPEAALTARLPDDAPSGIGWSDTNTRPPVDPTSRHP